MTLYYQAVCFFSDKYGNPMINKNLFQSNIQTHHEAERVIQEWKKLHYPCGDTVEYFIIKITAETIFSERSEFK